MPDPGLLLSSLGPTRYNIPSQAAACDTPRGTIMEDPAFIPASKARRLNCRCSYVSPGI